MLPTTITPLRVLCVLANPSDLPRFDDKRLGQEISNALQPMVSQGTVVLECMAEATENALRRTLSQSSYDVLYLIAHGQERVAANYATIALQSSEGRCRSLTAAALAALVRASQATRLVIAQCADEAGKTFPVLANALSQNGIAVLTAPQLTGRAVRAFISKLFAALNSEAPADSIIKELQLALEGEIPNAKAIQMFGAAGNQPLFSRPESRAAAAASAESRLSVPAALPLQNIAPPIEPAWHELLRRKRDAGRFDVFLCHNSADKPAVKRVAQHLKEAGILPWLDEWELPPGQAWQPLLEKQIGNIKSAAVFVGSAGMGPWQQQELYGLLNEFANRRLPVIPVLLPDAPSKPELPIFLRAMTWVDFRSPDPDPQKMLVWGITGERPEDS